MTKTVTDANLAHLISEYSHTSGSYLDQVYLALCELRDRRQQSEPKVQFQVHVQRNVIGLDSGMSYPKNCEHVAFGPVFDTQDAAILFGQSKGWMDIWWHVEQLNREAKP